MGLRLLMKPENGETADLFSDELFQRSQAWKLSTSGLSAGYQFRGTGFGAMYPDGYGINCKRWFMFLASFFTQRSLCNWEDKRALTGSVCVCFLPPRFFRSCGTGFDKVWDRVEKILRGNFHGRFHRRHRSGFARHAGYLRAGVQLDAGFCASMTTSFGGGLDEAGGRENRGVHV